MVVVSLAPVVESAAGATGHDVVHAADFIVGVVVFVAGEYRGDFVLLGEFAEPVAALFHGGGVSGVQVVDGAVHDDNFVSRFPAVQTRPVVNTIGAGDALFSAFLHAYMQSRNPIDAIKKAIVFASHKIGGTSAAEGFLSDSELEKLYAEVADQLNY